MIDTEKSSKPTMAVAGASGFVGSHLRAFLSQHYQIRGLTRSLEISRRGGSQDNTWRRCDFYSLPQLTEALRGCECALYLVHSMAPSSRLVQANFEDTDLLLADNFIRAAEAAGVRHVLYLGGLMPKGDEKVSPHLRSRGEVERVLRGSTVKVTVLRAGLIFGPGGSSFSMLVNLVRRLPVMILPRWAESQTHSIDIQNVCEAFLLCLQEADLAGGQYDLGGHDPMTYRELILRTGELLGYRIRAVGIPANCFALSKHWVSVISGVPTALVGPLQESLQHNLRAEPNPVLDRLSNRLISLEQSLRRSADELGRPQPNPRKATQRSDVKDIRNQRRVLSVQRMPLPINIDAQEISLEYGRWLTKSFRGLLQVDQDREKVIRFKLFGRVSLLELKPTPYTLEDKRRCAFYITGGLLSRNVTPQGRLEFRLFPERDCLIASIHGFSPMLPWWIYRYTQAVVHLWVMRAYARHLRRLGKQRVEEV